VLRFSGAGVSDTGRRREHNEDAAYVAPYVAVVADGVGGAAAGEVASATAAYVLAATALARFGRDPVEVAREAVAAALVSLRAGAAADERREGMATTLTGVLCDGVRVALVHVGDSRAYLWRAGTLVRLTRDHTYVQQLVDDGELDPAAAPTHPWRHVVARSLHSSPELPEVATRADVTLVADLAPGDRLLLCSDGVSDLVPERRISEVLRLGMAGAAAAVLVQHALEAGGSDNATAVVLDVVEGAHVVGDGRFLGALADLGNIVDPAYVPL
jgi:PPM family protein phosphatase